MPVVNGTAGQAAVYGAVLLMALIIVSITVIVSRGQTIPDVLQNVFTLLTGFLIGSRVVTPRVAREVQRQEAEKGAAA